jgi:protein-tyrosine kinase
MPPADHLIERAAALLQNAAARSPDPMAPGGITVARVTQAPLPRPVPLPPAKPAVVDTPAAALADELDPPPLPDGMSGVIPLPQALQPAVLQPATPQPATTQPATPQPATSRPATPQPATVQPATPQPGQPPISLDVLQAAGMVVARSARTRISEEYRIVLGRVLRALREEQAGGASHAAPSNLVMVTSARPGEGKSFTSLNLAGSIAQHTAEKVLLVDLDAKLRPVTVLLGAQDGPGFYDLVANPALRPESVVRATAIANLQFLSVGRRPSEATGTLDVQPITTTIMRIAKLYPKHVIVLDAPPCLSTSDPATVAPFVGQVVMVIEAERTQRSEVEAALELVRVCPTITMLLNKVRLTTSHTFGAYDYYGNYS